MKKHFYILLLLISGLLLLLSCSKKVSSTNDLIYDLEAIDEISLLTPVGDGTSKQSSISNKEKIEEVLNVLENIEVEEISLEQMKEIYTNQEVWAQKNKYEITLIATKETSDTDPSAGFKGHVTVLKDGNLIVTDTKTIGPFKDGKVERTISYLTTEKQTAIVDKIVKIIEK